MMKYCYLCNQGMRRQFWVCADCCGTEQGVAMIKHCDVNDLPARRSPTESCYDAPHSFMLQDLAMDVGL